MAEYGKGGNWMKYVLVYLVVGIIVYGLIWYFFLGGNKGGGYSSSGYTAPKTNTSPSY